MASGALETMPDELMGACESLAVRFEDWPDDATLTELDIGDPFELLAVFRSGKEILPGIQKKTANDDDVLIMYRRPILDMWCETGDDLGETIRTVMIEEIGRHFEFTEDEIVDFTRRHHQGILVRG